VGLARLDRPGRMLVVLLVAGLLIALPVLGVTMYSVVFDGGGEYACATSECREGFLWVLALPATFVVVAVIVTVWRMVRGGAVAPVLSAILGFIVGAWGAVRLVTEHLEGQEPNILFAVVLMVVGFGGLMRPLWSSLRLVARLREPRGL
jgi:hypothetical protein